MRLADRLITKWKKTGFITLQPKTRLWVVS